MTWFNFLFSSSESSKSFSNSSIIAFYLLSSSVIQRCSSFLLKLRLESEFQRYYFGMDQLMEKLQTISSNMIKYDLKNKIDSFPKVRKNRSEKFSRQVILKMNRQIKEEQTFASIYSSPHSRSTPKAQLSQLISMMSKEQQRSLAGISERCSSIEDVIASIQVIVSKVGERVQKVTQEKETELLSTLKMKQNQFIVGELKASLAKQLKKEERISEELDCERRKVEKFRDEIFKLQARNNSLTDKVNRLQYAVKEKDEEIKRITSIMHKQKQQHEISLKSRAKSHLSSHKEQKSQCYEEFEVKIEELQRQLEDKVSALDLKNRDLSLSLKKMTQQLEEERSISKMAKKKFDQMNMSKYQTEIKRKQLVEVNSELQDSYNKLLEKSKNTEIALHKQIQDFKTKQVNLRNQYKKEKKNFKNYLSHLAQFINNNSKYYLIANNVNEQVQEIKKLFQKTVKKKTEQFTRQSQYYQGQLKKYKGRNQELEQSVSILQKKDREREKKEKRESLKMVKDVISDKDIESSQKLDKRSDGGSSLINRSTDKSDEDRHRTIEEKYKGKLQVLRKDLKVKQTRINQLQKSQQVQFDRSKERILELQLSLSEKGNEIRKFDMKSKEKEYETNELKSAIRQMENKVAYLGQKLENEKQSSNKILEMKTQNYEQKMRNLKGAHKQLEKREQEKTIKYNKLKAKYEKYELEASQSLRRKNLQLDQLIKENSQYKAENSKFKAENRLLEEKINITNIIEKEVHAGKTPMPPNQDLIEQIEMEKDRVSSELIEKQKQCSQIIQVNTKMSSEILLLKRELRETKHQVQEMSKEHRYLQQENRFAKEKLEELKEKQNEDNEENHIYFKRQLEKNITNLKKLQHTCEKLSSQKKNYKRQVEDLNIELTNTKSTVEKLKTINVKLSDEVLDEKQLLKKTIGQYEIKLSECNAREEQLVDIINYKNRETGHIRESMKGEELLLQHQQHPPADSRPTRATSTHDLIIYASTQVNTEQPAPQNPAKESIKAIIPLELIGQSAEDQEQLLQTVHKKEEEAPKEANYFNNLVQGEEECLDDNFDICDEEDQININKAALSLDVFNSMRRVIEKLFNQEDVSIEEVRVLPRQLEDDFNQFISYIKEKIYEIKSENNLSFIMAQVGNQPEPIQQELTQFVEKVSPQYMRLRKIIEEKEYMITGLMNEKTEQENTINQLTVEKEEMEQENENKFMNQCTIYKKEIKEYKRLIDILEMNCQSLKNIFKNTLQLWVDQNDNEDDIKDNFVLYINISKLSEHDQKKLYHCLDWYRQMKRNS